MSSALLQNALLQTNAGTTGLVNAAIVVLIIVFLTLPMVFILADYLRGRRSRAEGSASAMASLSLEGQAQAAPAAPSVQILPIYAPGTTVSAPAPAPAPAVQVASVQVPAIPAPAPGEGVRRVATAHVAHDFTREAVPPEIGYLPPGCRVDGPLAHAGHLQVGPGCTVTGDVEVTGSLALGDGAYAARSVRATGNVYLGRATQVGGTVTAGGRVFLVSWSRAAEVRAEGPVELEEGAQVTKAVEAPEVEHVDRVHDPLVRARQAVHVAVVPAA